MNIMRGAFRLPAALLLGLGLAVGILRGQEGAASEPLVMTRLAAFLENGHVSERKLDDEISERAFTAYLDALDPLKMYFTAADVARFRKHERRLDDMVKGGDSSFAHEVFKTFLARVDDRTRLAEKLVEEKHDFTVEETFVTDGESAAWAKDAAESDDRWRRRIKYDLLTMKAAEVAPEEALTRLKKRYADYRERLRKTPADEVLGIMLSAVASSFDPHTTYMAPNEYEDFQIQMRLNYQGIGAILQDEDGYPIVKQIFPGGSAGKDGRLLEGDKIVAVGQGADGPMQDVVGMRLRDVVKLIRGPEGSLVRLSLLREKASFTLTLERKRTELEEAEAKGEVVTHEVAGAGTLKIGVIDLPSFYGDPGAPEEGRPTGPSATTDVARILGELKEKGIDAVVLDMRRNSGGLLSEAIGITGLFIDQGPVVQVKSGGRVRVRGDRESGQAWSGPLVVLVSRASASASEIVAGAVTDYARGLVVGDPSTHGKGTVQTLVDLKPDDAPEWAGASFGALKLTIQQFYRPDGVSTQRVGVASDVVLPSVLAQIDEGEAALPFALESDRVTERPHSRYTLIDPTIAVEVAEASRARVQKDPHFVALRKEIALIDAVRKRKSVSLVEERFLAERRELEEIRREDPTRHPAGEAGAEGEKKKEEDPAADPYLREVFAITSDYLTMLRDRGLLAHLQ